MVFGMHWLGWVLIGAMVYFVFIVLGACRLAKKQYEEQRTHRRTRER